MMDGGLHSALIDYGFPPYWPESETEYFGLLHGDRNRMNY